MSISKTDKVFLGITVVIATVAASAVRLWMGFPVLVVGIIASVTLVRLLNAPGRGNAAATDSSASMALVEEVAEKHRALNEELSTDPINKHLAGNIWHALDRRD